MNKFRSFAVAVAVVLSSSAALPVFASDKHHDHHKAQAKPAAAGAELAEGEVRRIDKEAGKLTIRHGEIRSIDMPPMTMVFEVREKKLLEGLQPGSKIRFQVVNESGKLIVTELKKQP